MPLYEYECKEDGRTISLLRPMKDADAPVNDPDGQGGTFVRKHSTFSVAAGGSPSRGELSPGAGCGCGNPHGPCPAG